MSSTHAFVTAPMKPQHYRRDEPVKSAAGKDEQVNCSSHDWHSECGKDQCWHIVPVRGQVRHSLHSEPTDHDQHDPDSQQQGLNG